MVTKARVRRFTFAALLAASPLLASAVTDQQYETIKRLGTLNGIALHCGYIDQTRTMKAGLVKRLPKRRALGQAFDDVTNRSFLAFIESGESCPPPQQFADEVAAALGELDRVFAR